VSRIERALSEEVTMFVAFPASKWDVFIVNGLRPVLVMVFQCDGSWERLSYVQVHTDSCIRCIALLLGGFGGLDIDANGVANAGQDLFQLEFLG
jgi:hypothetical protein